MRKNIFLPIFALALVFAPKVGFCMEQTHYKFNLTDHKLSPDKPNPCFLVVPDGSYVKNKDFSGKCWSCIHGSEGGVFSTLEGCITLDLEKILKVNDESGNPIHKISLSGWQKRKISKTAGETREVKTVSFKGLEHAEPHLHVDLTKFLRIDWDDLSKAMKKYKKVHGHFPDVYYLGFLGSINKFAPKD